MSEKKFEITYSDEEKKVVKPLLNCVQRTILWIGGKGGCPRHKIAGMKSFAR